MSWGIIDEPVNEPMPELPPVKKESNSDQITNFVEKHKGWITLIILIAMIALIAYFILNIQFLKANPVEFCQKAGCYCMNGSLIY